jgi:hypothetical protein
MEDNEKQIINVCLNDNKTQEYYSNIIKKRYKYTMQLLARARVAYEEYRVVELPLKSKNFSFQNIQEKILKKDYSVPDNFISLLDHLLVLNVIYKMLVNKDIPSVKERLYMFLTVDRVLHLLVEKVGWYTGYFQSLFISKYELSKLIKERRAKKTAKTKQDCIEAYYKSSPSERSTRTDHWICTKTVPKILIDEYGYVSIEKAQEMKKNGLKKPEKTVPSKNILFGHLKDDLPPKQTGQ